MTKEEHQANIPKCKCGNNLSKVRVEQGIDYCPACESASNADKTFEFGDYIISRYGDSDYYWIEHKSGEGSEFDKSDVDELIDKFYKENVT